MPSSRVITTVTFEKLMSRLAPDRERAAEVYETLRRRLTKYFDLKGLESPDTAADEALDRMALKIEAGEEVRDLVHYAFAVAHWVYLERFRAEDRERRAYARLTETRADNNEHLAAPYFATLEDCLHKLGSTFIVTIS